MSVKKRMKEYIKSQKFTISSYEKGINVSNGYVNSISKGIGGEVLLNILEKSPNLNIEWLLTGKGSMLREQKSGINQNVVGDGVTMVGGSVSGGSVQSGNTNTDNKKVQLFENQIKELKKEIKEKDKTIQELVKQVSTLLLERK